MVFICETTSRYVQGGGSCNAVVLHDLPFEFGKRHFLPGHVWRITPRSREHGFFSCVQARDSKAMGKVDMMGGCKPVIMHEAGCEEGWDDERHGRVKWRTLFSSDRTPTDSLTAGVAEIRPGDTFKVHRHEPAEVYYFIAGEGVVTIDGVENPVRANSAVYIPGNAAHGIRNSGSGDLRFFYVFAVDSFGNVDYEEP